MSLVSVKWISLGEDVIIVMAVLLEKGRCIDTCLQRLYARAEPLKEFSLGLTLEKVYCVRLEMEANCRWGAVCSRKWTECVSQTCKSKIFTGCLVKRIINLIIPVLGMGPNGWDQSIKAAATYQEVHFIFSRFKNRQNWTVNEEAVGIITPFID